MKKYSLLLLLCSISASAATGSNHVSHLHSVTYNSGNQVESYVHLSNISAHATTVTIKMFNADGTLLKDHENNDSSTSGLIKASAASYYDEQAENYTVRFTLEPKKSIRVWLDNLSAQEILGFAQIEWSNLDTTAGSTALIGHATVYRSYNGVGYYSVPVNDGKPF